MNRILLASALLLMIPSTVTVAQQSEAPALTEAEAAQLQHSRNVFNKYDLDKDGVISHKEFFADVTKAFVEKDKNRDGVLSFEEASIAPADQTEIIKNKMMEKKNDWQKKLGEKLMESAQ